MINITYEEVILGWSLSGLSLGWSLSGLSLGWSLSGPSLGWSLSGPHLDSQASRGLVTGPSCWTPVGGGVVDLLVSLSEPPQVWETLEVLVSSPGPPQVPWAAPGPRCPCRAVPSPGAGAAPLSRRQTAGGA